MFNQSKSIINFMPKHMKVEFIKEQKQVTKIICVQNIPEEIDNRSLIKLFTSFGTIKEYKRLMNCNSEYLDFCYLTYKEESSLFYLYRYLNNYNIDKYNIFIEIVREYQDSIDNANENEDNINLENLEGFLITFKKESSNSNKESYNRLNEVASQISTEIEYNKIFKRFMDREDILERCLKLQDKLIKKVNKKEEQFETIGAILDKFLY